MPTFIFIAGGSGSGKTTLAHKLSTKLNHCGHSSQVFTMDDYFHVIPEGREIGEFRSTTNFDREEMYDYELLIQDLRHLADGITINKAIFDFPTNKRLTYESIVPSEFVIVEGLFALAFAKKHAADLAKLTVFIGQSWYKTLIDNRVARDTGDIAAGGRGHTKEQVISKERKFVGWAFFHAISDSKSGVDVDVVNDPYVDRMKPHPLEHCVDEIIQELKDKEMLKSSSSCVIL
jgi:uridine kinase